MANIFKSGSIYLLLFILSVGLYSCTKSDDFKSYAQNGEIVYPGKVDSLKVYSGHNRVLVWGLFIADQKVTVCKVFWNSRKDSLVIPVVRKNRVDTLSQLIPNLSEATYNFEVVTYDKTGNKSVTVFATGISYGDRYQASLSARPVNTSATDSLNLATITWSPMDKTAGPILSKVTYTLTDNSTATVTNLIDSLSPTGDKAGQSTTTYLPKYKYGSGFSYVTFFRPDTLSIDTFSVIKSIPNILTTDVTKVFLVNSGNPFTYSAWDGAKVGNLSGWTTTADVLSGNKYGGYQLVSGVSNLSIEYISATIPNGKIYQTVTLPAGTYTWNITTTFSGGTRYMVVAAGTGLPDFANVTTSSLAYILSGSAVLPFTLTATTTVTIGFVANLTATGQYLRVSNMQLLRKVAN